MQDDRRVRRKFPIVPAGALLIGALFAAAAGQAFGQDAAFGRSVWVSASNCADCHGWMGDGVPEDPRSPKGANLRETFLNQEQLVEVILCGRPGTAMPHFDRRAYTDQRCYGLTRAELGDATPPTADLALTARHAGGLAAFILSEFAGKGAPTFEDCTELLGAENPRCTPLPHRGN